MKQRLTLAVVLAFLPLLSACGVADTTLSADVSVHTHFYPMDNGVVYTYSRYYNNRYDTISCRMVVGQRSIDKNALVITTTNTPLYYVGFMPDGNGNQAAVLQRGDTTLLALDGPLVSTATWMADQNHSVQATVVDRYDDYYLPGRLEHFSDVIAVKYHTVGEPDNVYTLRFFARDHGLILERQLALYGEIASLQLISIQTP